MYEIVLNVHTYIKLDNTILVLTLSCLRVCALETMNN